MDGQHNTWKQAVTKALRSFSRSAPTIIGVILLIGVFQSAVTPESITRFFSHGNVINSLIGGIAGSILTGNPITSYVIGGELTSQGVSLVAVTAFLVSWTTVSFIQFPAEQKHFGLRFALARNLTSLVLTFIVAILTVTVVTIL